MRAERLVGSVISTGAWNSGAKSLTHVNLLFLRLTNIAIGALLAGAVLISCAGSAGGIGTLGSSVAALGAGQSATVADAGMG